MCDFILNWRNKIIYMQLTPDKEETKAIEYAWSYLKNRVELRNWGIDEFKVLIR